jgi:hypothetical protein
MYQGGPRCAYRIVKNKDDSVVDEILEQNNVFIGMVAGWPTAEQYESAAKRAMEHARLIREKGNKLGL